MRAKDLIDATLTGRNPLGLVEKATRPVRKSEQPRRRRRTEQEFETPDFQIGSRVRVRGGPFADNVGTVTEITKSEDGTIEGVIVTMDDGTDVDLSSREIDLVEGRKHEQAPEMVRAAMGLLKTDMTSEEITQQLMTTFGITEDEAKDTMDEAQDALEREEESHKREQIEVGSEVKILSGPDVGKVGKVIEKDGPQAIVVEMPDGDIAEYSAAQLDLVEHRWHEQSSTMTELPEVGDVVEVRGRVPDAPAATVGEVLSPADNGVQVEWDGGGVSFVAFNDLVKTGDGSWEYKTPIALSSKKRTAARVERFRREAQIKVDAEAIGEQPKQLGAEISDFLEAEGIENKFETDGGLVLLDLEEDGDAEQAVALIQQFFQAPTEVSEVMDDEEDDEEDEEEKEAKHMSGHDDEDDEEEDEARHGKMKKRREQDDDEEEEDEEEEGRKREQTDEVIDTAAGIRDDFEEDGITPTVDQIVAELEVVFNADLTQGVVTRADLKKAAKSVASGESHKHERGDEDEDEEDEEEESRKHEQETDGLVGRNIQVLDGREGKVIDAESVVSTGEILSMVIEFPDGTVETFTPDEVDIRSLESKKHENESPKEHAIDLLKGGAEPGDVVSGLVDEFGIDTEEAADIVQATIEDLMGESKKNEQAAELVDAANGVVDDFKDDGVTPTVDQVVAELEVIFNADIVTGKVNRVRLTQAAKKALGESHKHERGDAGQVKRILQDAGISVDNILIQDILDSGGDQETLVDLLDFTFKPFDELEPIIRVLQRAVESRKHEQDAPTGEKLDPVEVGDPVMMADDENKVGVVTDMFDDGSLAIVWDQGEETIMPASGVRLVGVEKVTGDDLTSGVAEARDEDDEDDDEEDMEVVRRLDVSTFTSQQIEDIIGQAQDQVPDARVTVEAGELVIAMPKSEREDEEEEEEEEEEDEEESLTREQAEPTISTAVDLALAKLRVPESNINDIVELLTETGTAISAQAIKDALDQVIGDALTEEDRLVAVIEIGQELGVDVSGVSV